MKKGINMDGNKEIEEFVPTIDKISTTRIHLILSLFIISIIVGILGIIIYQCL